MRLRYPNKTGTIVSMIDSQFDKQADMPGIIINCPRYPGCLIFLYSPVAISSWSSIFATVYVNCCPRVNIDTPLIPWSGDFPFAFLPQTHEHFKQSIDFWKRSYQNQFNIHCSTVSLTPRQLSGRFYVFQSCSGLKSGSKYLFLPIVDPPYFW